MSQDEFDLARSAQSPPIRQLKGPPLEDPLPEKGVLPWSPRRGLFWGAYDLVSYYPSRPHR
jgi:hypothetical protein